MLTYCRSLLVAQSISMNKAIGRDVTDKLSATVASATADATGEDERSVRRAAARGEALGRPRRRHGNLARQGRRAGRAREDELSRSDQAASSMAMVSAFAL